MCKCRISSWCSEIQWDCSDTCVMLRQYTHTHAIHTRTHLSSITCYCITEIIGNKHDCQSDVNKMKMASTSLINLLHKLRLLFRTRNIQVRQKQTTANVTLHHQKINIHYIIWVADKITYYSQWTWPKCVVPYPLWRFVLPYLPCYE